MSCKSSILRSELVRATVGGEHNMAEMVIAMDIGMVVVIWSYGHMVIWSYGHGRTVVVVVMAVMVMIIVTTTGTPSNYYCHCYYNYSYTY